MKRREFIGLIGTAALSFPRPGYAQTGAGLPLVGGFASRTRLGARRGSPRSASVCSRRASLKGRTILLPCASHTEISSACRRSPRSWALSNLGSSSPHPMRPAWFIEFFRDLPLVFTAIAADPIAIGLAQSYARPGGMATGNVMNAIGGEEALTEKRIGLFKELVPGLTRLGMIGTTNDLVSVAEQECAAKSGW